MSDSPVCLFDSLDARFAAPGAIPTMPFMEATIPRSMTSWRRCTTYGCRLVEITGGEPLAQPESLPLMTRLCDAGYTVLLETSGAVDITPVDPRTHIILDVKCPGSGMTDRMLWPNLSWLTAKDEAKFVLADRADYDWARGILAQYDVAGRCSVLFSPVFGSLDVRHLAEWILADRLPVRFQLQMHKYIWAPDMRGV